MPWEGAHSRSGAPFEGHTGGAQDCAFSPDGHLLLSASTDQTLRLWDVESGQMLRTFAGHTDEVFGCVFSPDGRLALSASYDRTLRLWDVGSRQEITQWLTDAGLSCCAFNSDGRRVVAGDAVGSTHFLEVMGVSGGADQDEAALPIAETWPEERAAEAQVPQRRGWWPFGRR